MNFLAFFFKQANVNRFLGQGMFKHIFEIRPKRP